ncbi:MAG TPA: MFS transporter [Micromonosporaceae bacterium]
MPVMRTLGRTVGVAVRGARLTVRGSARTGRWVSRRVRVARTRGAAGEVGMMRLLDLHAVSCAGDTLVTMGLAGTIFFNVPVGEARPRVALYLLITMAPFALLAPVVGPLLDRYRHGRRYALAVTMLGRAFLAWLISDYIHGFGLYPAAFGVLVLSRAYGVARSAAVPRLLPAGLRLSEAGARASVFGTVAGAVVAPIGVAAFWFGPQWPLRVATVIFAVGAVVALRLPPRADSDPPETLPRLFTLLGTGRRVLRGRVVTASLTGSAVLRGLFGFLTLFLAFAIRSDDLTTRVAGYTLSQPTAIGLVAGALGVGSFLATAAGTRLRIRRPVLLQTGVLVVVAALGVVATARYTLGSVALLCLATAIASGLAKLAVDAAIQERIPEQVRASAFAHAETMLMLAWVAGGAAGLIPFAGRLGLGVLAAAALVGTLFSVFSAYALRGIRLTGTGGPLTGYPEPEAERPTRRRWIRRTAKARPAGARDGTTLPVPVPDPEDTEDLGFHLYRPSGVDDPSRAGEEGRA